MTVYVDRARHAYRGMVMCHLLADTEDELHEMAEHIGLKRAWFQTGHGMPHYDVSLGKRKAAIQAGAIEIGLHQVGEMLRRWRRTRDCGHCSGKGTIETDNNGPIGPCPVCRPNAELSRVVAGEQKHDG